MEIEKKSNNNLLKSLQAAFKADHLSCSHVNCIKAALSGGDYHLVFSSLKIFEKAARFVLEEPY